MSPAEGANRWTHGGADSPSGAAPERTRAALAELIAERGYDQVRLEDLLARLGINAAQFETSYGSLEACFKELWEEARDSVVERTALAFFNGNEWRDGMRAAAWALCGWLEEDQRRARIFMIELNSADEILRASRDVVFDNFAALIHLGNGDRPTPVPRIVADGVIGAIWDQISATVNEDAFQRLAELVPEMMYLTVMPYLGPTEAEEELRRGPEDIARHRRGEI